VENSKIAEALVAVHQEIQRDLGQDPSQVTRSTCPLTGLAGFQSPLIPNALRALGHRVGISFPEGTRLGNLYVSRDGRSKLTIDEIAAQFNERYCQEATAA